MPLDRAVNDGKYTWTNRLKYSFKKNKWERSLKGRWIILILNDNEWIIFNDDLLIFESWKCNSAFQGWQKVKWVYIEDGPQNQALNPGLSWVYSASWVCWMSTIFLKAIIKFFTSLCDQIWQMQSSLFRFGFLCSLTRTSVTCDIERPQWLGPEERMLKRVKWDFFLLNVLVLAVLVQWFALDVCFCTPVI